MNPIYEQGRGKGIGYTSESFSQRFDDLCQRHLRRGRARSFAFIFYDFNDREFKEVLKDEGVFAKLDRLSGDNLSIFYLHSGRKTAIKRFNSEFLSRLDLKEQVSLPAIVFFKLTGENITDVTAVHLESANLIHGFHELHDVISRYISEEGATGGGTTKYWNWITSTAKSIALESFRALLRAAFSMH